MDFSSPHNLAFAESLLEQYRADPSSVDESWRAYFEQLPALAPASVPGPEAELQFRVARLVEAYRARGVRYARLDPLGLALPAAEGPGLAEYGLVEADLDRPVSTGSLAGPGRAPLREVLARLRETYCGHVGMEFAHIEDDAARTWLRKRVEDARGHMALPADQRRRVLRMLIHAQALEQFLHARFVGAKRFSLEGGESLIPLLDLLVERGGRRGVHQVVLGMAHRGRLNVLVNILDTDPAALFADFQDLHPEGRLGSGDVKHHLGFSSDRKLDTGQAVHLALAFNPSHLEWVGAVVEGRARAKQDRGGDLGRTMCLPVLVHGDAAFAGQGLVMETMQLAGLPGYATGGTIHVVVNNQVGFTTPPEAARSTPHCSDIGRMFHVPVLHVNGDDPDAVAFVAGVALEFRQHFHRDVIIDFVCYRKWGHSEGDEPAFTQPRMCQAIEARRPVAELYERTLIDEGAVTAAGAEAMRRDYRASLERRLAESKGPGFRPPPLSPMAGPWLRYRGGRDADTPDVDTGVPQQVLAELLTRLASVPQGFEPHPKLVRLLEQRREMAAGKRPLDWGAAEALAFATLLAEGHPVRVSGQDSQRGTFAHRHAVLHSQADGSLHVPLAHVGSGQARFDVLDSPLSEAGVLGFEYGYSLDCPDGLVVWEAQFGDFANAGQVIIDQFITSAEVKWNRLSALTLFLPHGFEGQGPEHSSARVGRFLHLCAKDNIQVCNVTTPAQLFHLLRRQVVRPLRKPLVLFTPKSLLRHPLVASELDELARGRFQRLLPDAGADPAAVKRVLLSSGKVHGDLAQARAGNKIDNVALVRLEQFYPFPLQAVRDELSRYAPGTPLAWVQEEPVNMGGWHFLRDHLPGDVRARNPLSCVSRPENASPATGSPGAHRLEQERLVEAALRGPLDGVPLEVQVVQVSAHLPV